MGSSACTIHFAGSESEELDAYKLLKFSEEIGVPFRIPGVSFAKKAAMEAIARLREAAPYWSMSTMLRIGDVQAVDKIYNRKSMVAMLQVEVDSLARSYCIKFEKILFGKNFKDSAQRDLLKNVVPELLSRLISKCSSDVKKAVFTLLEKIYQSDDRNNYLGVEKLTRRLMKALSIEEFFEYLPALVQFPIRDPDQRVGTNTFPNPLSFTEKSYRDYLKHGYKVSLDNPRLVELIRIVGEGSVGKRKWAIYTLWELKRLGMLTADQEIAFCDAVWSSVDDQGFPKDTDFYKFAMCRDLCPVNIRGDQLVKSYILSEQIQTQKQLPGRGVSMTSGDMPLCSEIIGASEFVEWTATESHLIFNKLLCWWDLDKEFLEKYQSVEIREEFELRFAQLKEALISAVSRCFSSEEGREVLALQKMVHEMENYGLPVFSIKCAFSHAVPIWRDNLIADVSMFYLDVRTPFIRDAIYGLYSLIERDSEDFELVIQHFLDLLGSSLLVRDKNRLLFSLAAAFNIISKYKKYFSKIFESSVLFALDKLKAETSFSSDRFELHESLYIRKVSAQLAYCLYQHYQNVKVQAPEVIDHWRAICESPDEFVETRNAWEALS